MLNFILLAVAGFIAWFVSTIAAGEHLQLGLVLGLAALLASWLGKRALERMQSVWFRRLVIAAMVVSGLIMIWEQRELLGL
jgi:uncharacterized membrane protein YfcA